MCDPDEHEKEDVVSDAMMNEKGDTPVTDHDATDIGADGESEESDPGAGAKLEESDHGAEEAMPGQS